MGLNSDENIKSNRDTSLDAVCGLFIIYMITRHAFQWSGCRDDCFYRESGNWLYMFLPWFFYKSGMFHKEGNTKIMIKHDAYKLLKPYIVYTIIGSIIYYCSHWVLFYIVAIIFGYNNDNNYPNYKELLALLAVSAIILPLLIYSIKRLETKKSHLLKSE